MEGILSERIVEGIVERIARWSFLLTQGHDEYRKDPYVASDNEK